MAAPPEELIEEILLRLPVKSLLRFETASKMWYSLISDNYKFAKLHLKQSSSATKNLIFHVKGMDGPFWSSDIDNHESHKAYFPLEIPTPSRMLGLANGLICCEIPWHTWCPFNGIRGDFCYLWNPCTAMTKTIYVPFTGPNFSKFGLFGFGYDSISDDYKILGYWDSHLRVIFSLKTNSWKMLDYDFQYSTSVSAFYLNGALHWCVGRHITAFDLTKDKLSFIKLPQELALCGNERDWVNLFGYQGNERDWVNLFGYQGLLCASGRKSIWMMKEYGNKSSWAKLGTSLPKDYAKPFCISKLGEVVFGTEVGLVKCDTKGRMSAEDKSHMIVHGYACAYKESLISPKCFDAKI